MAANPSATASPFPLRKQHRALIWQLTKRDVFGRYRGASLGVVWSILTPFLLLGVYTIAFGEILKARWPGVNGTTDFALMLFVGLTLHAFMAECMIRAPSLIVSNTNYVKKVVFPLEILPWPVVFSGLFHLSMNMLVFVAAIWLVKGLLVWTIILLPIVVLPLVLMVLGTIWLLSSLGTYLRDIGQLMGPLTTALLFLSSAIVPVGSLPEKYRGIFQANPLTLIIDQARAVTLLGNPPNWPALATYTSIALAFCIVSYALFRKLKGGFADVL